MHFQPSGINCRPCIILHVAKKNSCRPVVSITRCACPAGMHVFISSATSGSAMKIAWAFTRCSPVKASIQRLHIKSSYFDHFENFLVWPFHLWDLTVSYLRHWKQTANIDAPRSHGQILWRDTISFRGFRCYPSSLRRQVILIKVNGFLVAKISKT